MIASSFAVRVQALHLSRCLDPGAAGCTVTFHLNGYDVARGGDGIFGDTEDKHIILRDVGFSGGKGEIDRVSWMC